MNQPNFNPGDNDAEDRGYVLWNEYDWQQYLKVSDAEIVRFVTTYLKHRHEANHLDLVAKALGWDREDWVQSNWEDEAPSDTFNPMPWSDNDEEFEAIESQLNTPYTVHRHPVYIVACGLSAHLRRVWHHFFAHFPHLIPSTMVWNLASQLSAFQINATMAIQSVDLGDFNLGVCHLKHALAALNQLFRTLGLLSDAIRKEAKELIENTQSVLFDLREVCLRVIQDCRTEARMDHTEEDDNNP
jgi:hypothetical protein